MYSHEEIFKKATKLAMEHGTRDPFRLAKGTGVIVTYHDLGSLKGMYTIIQRNRFCALNENLNEYEQRLICAHELGHDVLHRALALDRYLQEHTIYQFNNRIEYEANIFAAELLLPDEDVLELVKCGYDAAQIARCLETDADLAAIKLESLRQKGYGLRSGEYKRNFLRK